MSALRYDKGRSSYRHPREIEDLSTLGRGDPVRTTSRSINLLPSNDDRPRNWRCEYVARQRDEFLAVDVRRKGRWLTVYPLLDWEFGWCATDDSFEIDEEPLVVFGESFIDEAPEQFQWWIRAEIERQEGSP